MVQEAPMLRCFERKMRLWLSFVGDKNLGVVYGGSLLFLGRMHNCFKAVCDRLCVILY